MRVLIVGGNPETVPVSRALEAADVAVEQRADDPRPGHGTREIAAIARDLREIERALPAADAVLIASRSSAALAAVIVATKLGTPVARLGLPDDPADEGANARLIRQLADTAVAADPSAVLEWVRDSYAAEK